MVDNIAGKVIMVTGAASGFGRLVSEKAAARGAQLVCTDINEAGSLDTASAIQAAGGSAIGCRVDVTEMASLEQAVQAALHQYGRIDVMVNNAGTMPLAFFADHKAARAAWSSCIDINVKGVLNGILAVYDTMLSQGRGHIVNLSSIYGNYPVVGAGVYGATKAAVNFLSESLRVESQGKIKVTIVKPTGVPGTNLGSAIVNPEAIVGILGQNAPGYLQLMQAHEAGELPAEHTDAQHIEYYALAPEHLAEQIVYAIDQPWGVSIGDITVRASGDGYIL